MPSLARFDAHGHQRVPAPLVGGMPHVMTDMGQHHVPEEHDSVEIARQFRVDPGRERAGEHREEGEDDDEGDSSRSGT